MFEGEPETTRSEPVSGPEAHTTAAERALHEAALRRENKANNQQPKPVERQGRGGLDPVRYGDWEVKGFTSDF